MSKGVVHIIIQRDAKNVPFAKVLYNKQDAFNLDDNTKNFAGYLARKSVDSKSEGLVLVSTETGEVLENSEVNVLMSGYFISGSESGRQYVEDLINTVCIGASNIDIGAPVYVTDGKVPPIFINEENISPSYKQVDASTRNNREREKRELLNSLLEESSISLGKRM